MSEPTEASCPSSIRIRSRRIHPVGRPQTGRDRPGGRPVARKAASPTAALIRLAARARAFVLCCGRRCALIALVVGTIITAINQGDLLAQGAASASVAWKIPLNYMVPFVVSTLGYRAATAGRERGS